MSAVGTSATRRGGGTKAALRSEADISTAVRPGSVYEFTAWREWARPTPGGPPARTRVRPVSTARGSGPILRRIGTATAPSAARDGYIGLLPVPLRLTGHHALVGCSMDRSTARSRPQQVWSGSAGGKLSAAPASAAGDAVDLPTPTIVMAVPALLFGGVPARLLAYVCGTSSPTTLKMARCTT